MTPEELAARHPRLYHLTCRQNVEGIRAVGLLPTAALLARFGEAAARWPGIATERRAGAVTLEDGAGACAIISDNAPLNLRALEKCLEPGLAPRDWLAILNRRVFFWAQESRLRTLIGARNNRGVAKSVLVLDTLSVARRFGDRVELCAFNSGSAVRRAVRRGQASFSPLGRYGFDEWRALRGGRDTICEVTVTCAIPDVMDHVIEIRDLPPGE